MSQCSKPSIVPFWITIGFLSAAFSALIATCIYSISISKRSFSSNEPHESKESSTHVNVKEHKESPIKAYSLGYESVNVSQDDTWESLSCIDKFIVILSDVIGRKSVYVPLVLHLSDTASDFAAVAEFYIVAHSTTPEQCGGLNVWWLFLLSIICMLTYRVISSFTIYRITKSVSRVLLQFIDIELYHILYISHIMHLNGTSSPQRLISMLEAVFEAAPQSLIQIIYLMKSGGGTSNVVLLSVIFSCFNLTLAIIGDDANLLEIKLKKHTGKFVLLYLYRLFDIPTKILGFAFLWYFVSGFVCFLVLIIDGIVAWYLFDKTKNTDALIGIVAVPFSFGSKQFQKLLKASWVYSICETIVVSLVVWLFSSQQIFSKDSTGITGLLLYYSCASILKCFGTWRLFFVSDGFANTCRERSDINQLLNSWKYSDAMELIIFKNSNISNAAKTLYGDKVKYSLLAIAAACQNNPKIFQCVLKHSGLDYYKNETQYWTGLMEASKSGNIECIKRILEISNNNYVTKKDPINIFVSGRSALCYAVNSRQVVKAFLHAIDKNVTLNSIQILNDVREYDRNWNILHEVCHNRIEENELLEIFKECYILYRKLLQSNAKQMLATGNRRGKTPLDICKANSKMKIGAFIKTHQF
eukprot:28192_1